MSITIVPVIKFALLHSDAIVPKYKSSDASGLDLHVIDIETNNENLRNMWDEDNFIVVYPITLSNKPIIFRTGLSIEIPNDFEGQIRSRSGLAFNKNLFVLNSPGTIDADYRGELKIAIANIGNKEVIVHKNDRMAQLVICPVIRPQITVVDKLSDTIRGSDGIGSTGVQ